MDIGALVYPTRGEDGRVIGFSFCPELLFARDFARLHNELRAEDPALLSVVIVV
jgi:hypothetical protein